MMNDVKLNEYLNDYGRTHSPDPSRALIDGILAIPREVEQQSKVSWNIGDWFLFIVPRLSGLTAACVLGIYMGGAGGSALAEDEIAEIDQYEIQVTDESIILDENADTLLDVEEFIFVEEPTQ